MDAGSRTDRSAEALPGHWVDRLATAPGAHFELPSGLRGRLVRDALAIAEALFETDDGPPSAAELRWLGHQLHDYLGSVGPRSRFVVSASIVALATFTPLAAQRLRPFRLPRPIGRLPLPLRVAALARLERSPLSLNVLAVKAALCILWYEHPDHARAVGLTPGRPVRERGPSDGGSAS